MKPLINPSTENILKKLVKKMPQSLLLYGEDGLNLNEIASYIASETGSKIINILPEKEHLVDLDQGVITIELIRQLYQSTAIKSKQPIIVVINRADTMTIQAQNAFLKLLEEPTDCTNFLLLASNPNNLLATIMSRLVKIEIKPIDQDQSEELLNNLKINDKLKRQQLLFLASGLPEKITKLATDEKYFRASAQVIEDAKSLLTSSSYNRLLIINRYKDNRLLAIELTTSLTKIINSAIVKSPDKKLFLSLDEALIAQQAIIANANIRQALAANLL